MDIQFDFPPHDPKHIKQIIITTQWMQKKRYLPITPDTPLITKKRGTMKEANQIWGQEDWEFVKCDCRTKTALAILGGGVNPQCQYEQQVQHDQHASVWDRLGWEAKSAKSGITRVNTPNSIFILGGKRDAPLPIRDAQEFAAHCKKYAGHPTLVPYEEVEEVIVEEPVVAVPRKKRKKWTAKTATGRAETLCRKVNEIEDVATRTAECEKVGEAISYETSGMANCTWIRGAKKCIAS